MCNCYEHPCEVCRKGLPVHLGDFATDPEEIEAYCWKHIPKGDPDVKVWRFTEGFERRKYGTLGMAIKALTDNARANWDGNSPNACGTEQVIE
jgi:hypothetical protein